MNAELRPSVSLSTRGFLWFIAAIGGLSILVACVFYKMGAWPITGFFGLDIVLVLVAFRVNNARQKIAEYVRVCPDSIVITRRDRDGSERHWTVNPHWARVQVRALGRMHERVVLSAGGRAIAIGDFLSPAERVDFGAKLRDAIQRARAYPA